MFSILWRLKAVETIKFKRLDSTYISLLRNFIRRLYIIKRGWSCLLPSLFFFFFFTLILFSTKWTVLLSLEFRDDDSVIKKKARCGYGPFVGKFFEKHLHIFIKRNNSTFSYCSSLWKNTLLPPICEKWYKCHKVVSTHSFVPFQGIFSFSTIFQTFLFKSRNCFPLLNLKTNLRFNFSFLFFDQSIS